MGLLLAVALPGVTVRAQETSALTAGVASQTLLLQPDQAGVVILDIAGTLPDDAEVAVVVHNRLPADRAALQSAAAATSPQRRSGSSSRRLSPSPVTPQGGSPVQIPTTSTRSANGTQIPLRTAGVYPVEIVIRSTDRNEDLARVLVTFLVRLPSTAVAEPLRVAARLPPDRPARPPSSPTAPCCSTPPSVHAVRAAHRHPGRPAPGMPVTVMLQPELLEALGRTGLPTDVELRTRLAALLADRQTLPAPYVPMDPTAAVAAGLGDELDRPAPPRRGRHRRAARAQLGRAHDLVDPRRARRDDGGLPPRSRLPPAPGAGRCHRWRGRTQHGSRRAARERPVRGIRPSPDGGRRRRSVLAGVHRPCRARPGGLRLARRSGAHEHRGRRSALPDRSAWSCSPRPGTPTPASSPPCWPACQGNPLVRPATATQYFTEVPPAVGDDGQLVERGLAPSAPEDLTGYAADRTKSQLGLVAFGSMVAPTSSLPAELDQLLQVSPARDLSPQARSAYLTAVDEQLDELRQSVDQVPARTITLAGRTTELPITLTSRADEPLQVKVRLRSSKLAFPEGNERLVTITDGAAPVRVPIEARTSGTFPVTIDVLTPLGDQVVAPSSQLTVRSTGLSGLGLALSVGALLVLAMWWTRHVLSTRPGQAGRGSRHRSPLDRRSAGWLMPPGPPGRRTSVPSRPWPPRSRLLPRHRSARSAWPAGTAWSGGSPAAAWPRCGKAQDEVLARAGRGEAAAPPPRGSSDAFLMLASTREALAAARLVAPPHRLDLRQRAAPRTATRRRHGAGCGARPCARPSTAKGAMLPDLRGHLASVALARSPMPWPTAHASGLVHRDVKPGNILLGPTTAGCSVTDFGIAKAAEAGPGDDRQDLTEVGPRSSAPPSTSRPSRSKAKPLDGRSDVYAVGVVLYEMLCRLLLPFAATD